jgi:hypothetical protein
MRRARRRLSRAIPAGLVAAALVTSLLPALPALGKADPVKVTGREVVTSVEKQRTVPLPIAASHVALRWSGDHEAQVTVAFGTRPNELGEEVPVGHVEGAEHDDVGDEAEAVSGVLWTGGARFARVTTDRPLGKVTVVAIDARADVGFVEGGVAIANAAMSQPNVISRAGWGADESLRFDSGGNEIWPPSFSPLQKAIVHHTAGRNNDPNPAATVRAIYYMKAVGSDFGDIGYNFLIDEQGRIYEGRYSRPYAPGEIVTGEDLAGNVVRGGHARDYNDGTVGIALIGNFQNRQPTAAMRSALERYLAWKLERHGLNPKSQSVYTNPVLGHTKLLYNISGHRNVNPTACPGDTFYPTFPTLRQNVANRIAATTGSANDGTPPAVSSLTALTPGSTGGESIKFGLIFTEPVQGVEPSDFDIGGTSHGWSVVSITGSASTYTVTVGANSPDDGTIELTLGQESVTDLAGHDGPGSSATGQAVYAQDGDSPTVGLYHTPHKTYHNNPKLDYFNLTATFSEPVTGFTPGDVIVGGTSHAQSPWQVGLIFGSGASYGFSIFNDTWVSGTLNFRIPAGAVQDAAGNPVQASNIVSVIMDKAVPSTSTPFARLTGQLALRGSAQWAQLSWTGSDAGPAGIASYEVARSKNGKPFKTIASGSGNARFTLLKTGNTYRYRVRARDKAGNVGAWKTGPTLRPKLIQQTIANVHFSGATQTFTSNRYSGGSERSLLTAGTSARLTTSAQSLSFITTRGPNRGSVRIYIDGALAATIDLNAPTTTYRYVAYTKLWSRVGTHTIKVVAVGTAGHPRVGVDAFGVIR